MVIRHDFHQRQRWVTYKCYLLCCPSLVQDAIAETAKLLVENVFRLHGIPVEIVSERGPQFTSQVWKVFCIALWAKLCLSSGYHLQTNRQTERLNQEFEIHHLPLWLRPPQVSRRSRLHLSTRLPPLFTPPSLLTSICQLSLTLSLPPSLPNSLTHHYCSLRPLYPTSIIEHPLLNSLS